MVAPRIPRSRPLWRQSRPPGEYHRLHTPWPGRVLRRAGLALVVGLFAAAVFIAALEHPLP